MHLQQIPSYSLCTWSSFHVIPLYTANNSRGPTVSGQVGHLDLPPPLPHTMYWCVVCSSHHVLVCGVFLTPCTGLWCVPHPMYWSGVPHPMYWSVVCSSPHVLVCGVFLTTCTGLWCVPHPMYWSVVCSSSHVLVYGVFLTPCTGLRCVPHPMYWSMVCSSPHVLV